MNLIHIEKIKVNNRFRKDMGDIEALARSIETIGLLQPIGITLDYELVFGARRLAAFQHMGQKSIPCRYLSLPDVPLQAEHDENMVRLDFSPTEKVAIAKALETQEKTAARKRQKATLKQGNSRPENFSQRDDQDVAGRASDHVAAAVNWSRPTLEKAVEVVEAAKEDPERYGDLPDQMDRTGKVNGAHSEMRKRKGETKKAPAKDPWPHKVSACFDDEGFKLLAKVSAQWGGDAAAIREAVKQLALIEA